MGRDDNSNLKAFCEGGSGRWPSTIYPFQPARSSQRAFCFFRETMETQIQAKAQQCDVCHGAGYTWQQDSAGREDAEPIQQQCEACFQNVFTEETNESK